MFRSFPPTFTATILLVGTCLSPELLAQNHQDVRESAWKTAFSKPCLCDDSTQEAIPALWSNWNQPQRYFDFLSLLANSIDDFTADKNIPNKEKLILWSIYELGTFDVANALIRARKAGVEVRVVTDGKSVRMPPKNHPNYYNYRDRGVLTRAVYQDLVNAGVSVSFSTPEWTPQSTLFPPLMHEKVRVFAQKSAKGLLPLVAYVSTHNDTYSDTIGDPLATVTMERMKKGPLQRSEIAPLSFGNVQLSFVIRHAVLIQNLIANFLIQEKVYGQGTGRISQVPDTKPAAYSMKDGSRIVLSYTNGKPNGFNPNMLQAQFIMDHRTQMQSALLTEFVFSHTKTEQALLELVKANPAIRLQVAIDGNFAFQDYSMGRSMAGLYTVQGFRSDSNVLYPWAKEIRKNTYALSFNSHQDKLHLKNSIYSYKNAQGAFRYRIYTGSTNLSGNAASNREISFEIDTSSPHFAKVMYAQWGLLIKDPFMRPLAKEALLNRLMASARAAGDRPNSNLQTVLASLNQLISNLANSTVAFAPIMNAAPKPNPTVMAVNQFYTQLNLPKSAQFVSQDLHGNIQKTSRFWSGLSSVEVMLLLTQTKNDEPNPARHKAVLNLFK